MKKIFTILMVVTVIGAMVGCKGEEAPADPAAAPATTADAAN